MKKRALLVVVLGAFSVGACVLDADGFTRGDGASSAADGGDSSVAPPLDAGTGADGSAIDGASLDGGADAAGHGDAATDAGTDAAVDAGDNPNLLPNADFEKGCDGWVSGPNVDLSTVNEGRSGKACRICVTDTSGYAYIETSVSLPSGDRLLGEIWAKADKAKPIDWFSLLINYTGTQDEYDSPRAWLLPSSDVWTRLSIVQDVGAPAIKGALVLSLDDNPQKCVIIDDVMLRRLP